MMGMSLATFTLLHVLISLIGIGTDRNSSFLRGPAKAPAATGVEV